MHDYQLTFALLLLPSEEFVAHASNVNCLRIGRKSSGVMVTGGDDRKVNVWAVGRPGAILVSFPGACKKYRLCNAAWRPTDPSVILQSLSGHQSAVECVTFDTAEEVRAPLRSPV